jgi:hypothetical protein
MKEVMTFLNNLSRGPKRMETKDKWTEKVLTKEAFGKKK